VLLPMAAASAGYVCRVDLTVVAPGAMRDFALTQSQTGTVFSAFLVGYAVFQVPSDWLADGMSARHIFPVLCDGFTLPTVLTAMVAGHGFAAAKVIPQLSGEPSGIAGGRMNFGSDIGGAISPALTPWLAPADRLGNGLYLDSRIS
jgi:MFS family permease